LSKPKPAIYQAALRASKVKSNEAVYIDDLEENVAAATALGMIGIHCQVPQTLPDCLRAVGVTVP